MFRWQTVSSRRSHQNNPKLASMLPPMYGQAGNVAAGLVARNVEYHLKLDFSKVPPLRPCISSHARLESLVNISKFGAAWHAWRGLIALNLVCPLLHHMCRRLSAESRVM